MTATVWIPAKGRCAHIQSPIECYTLALAPLRRLAPSMSYLAGSNVKKGYLGTFFQLRPVQCPEDKGLR